MMKKNSIKKRALFMTLVVVLGFLASSLMVSSTYASYYSDHDDSPRSNSKMEMYYEAMKKCLGSSKSSTATINLSERSEANRKEVYDYYNLTASELFNRGSGSGDSNLLYSEILESEVAGGRQDGKLYCSELGNVFSKLLGELRLDGEDDFSKLLCNGSEPGIFKITAGYAMPQGSSMITTNTGVSGEDCSENLALYLEYTKEPNNNATIAGLSSGNNTFPFSIKFEIADNAADYFEDFVEPYLGSPSNRSTMDDWKYYKTFNAGCVKIDSGQTEVPPESSDMVGIYDLQSGRVYYHSPSQIQKDELRYIGVDDKEQMTCGELAEKLGADFTNGGVNEDKIDRLVKRNKKQDIKECVDKYLNALGEYGKYGNEYASTVEAGEDFARMAERVLNAIENGGSLAAIDDEVMAGVPYKDQFIVKFDNYYSSVMSGIGGQSIYSSEMTNNYLPKIRDRVLEYLNSSEISEDGRVVSTSVSADMIPTARGLLTRFQRETNDVKENSSKVDDFLRNKTSEIEYDENWFEKLWGGEQGELEIDYNALEGKVWDIEDGNVICHGLQDLKDDFEEMGLVNMPDIDTSFNPDDYQGGEGIGEDDFDGNECYNSGIEGITWLVCPAINNMAKAIDGIGGNIDRWLMIDSDWYSTDDGSGGQNNVKDVWENFRTIANVLMIIILLVIIVSQLTGYGIDNYGIKKILPRLIIMSILINLSFFICQIAVDLSNIFGKGLNDMFQSFGRTAFENYWTGSAFTARLVAGLFGLVSGAGAVSGFAFTIVGFVMGQGGMVMIGLSIALTLGIAFISIMLFFLTLASRAIIVIVFTAIAPVAFACYVLPNTQSFFKKWWDVFKAALLVYPICGALYGMSYVIRGIIIGGSGDRQWWMVLMAIMAPYLPFLVMPALVKGALAMLGKVGGTLSTLGTGARRGFMMGNAALQRTEAYKDAQKRAQRNMTARKAGAKILNKRTGELLRDENNEIVFNDPKTRLGRKLRGRGMMLARQQVSRDQAERASEEIASSSRGISASMAGAEAEAEAKWDRNAEALLGLGRATYDERDEEGKVVTKTVKPGNTGSVAAYHAASMEKYQEAKKNNDEQKMRETLSDIRAAQKILSRSGGGRDEVEENLKKAVAKGYGDSAKEASQHLQTNYGDLYKSKNRSSNALINELASGTEVSKVRQKLGYKENGEKDENGYNYYGLAGAKDYTPASLADADDGTFADIKAAVSYIRKKYETEEGRKQLESDAMKPEVERYNQIVATARNAIAMKKSNSLGMSANAEKAIREIAGLEDDDSEPGGDSDSGGRGAPRGDSNPTPPPAPRDSSNPTPSPAPGDAPSSNPAFTYRGAHPSGEGTVERTISPRGKYFVDSATGAKFTSQQFERIRHKLNKRRSDNVVKEGGNSEGSNAADSGSDGS